MSEDWYKWFPALYEADTLHLSLPQDAIYRRLIDWYMTKRRPPPDNDQALATIARVGIADWLENANQLRPFFKSRGGLLHHKRCNATLDEQDGKRKVKSEVATKGGESRWQSGQSRTAGHAAARSGRLAAARRKGTHTALEWTALVEFCGNVCCKCSGGGVVKDHIQPIYQGGSDAIDNLQPLCKTCNSAKGPDRSDYRKNGWLQAIDTAKQALSYRNKTQSTPATMPSMMPSKMPAERLPPPARGEEKRREKNIPATADSVSARPPIPTPLGAPAGYAEAITRVAEAAGNSANLVNLSRVSTWLKQGCDLDLDILPAIRARVAYNRKTEPEWAARSLAYFDHAIADARTARLKPMPEGRPNGGNGHRQPLPRKLSIAEQIDFKERWGIPNATWPEAKARATLEGIGDQWRKDDEP